MIIVAGAIVRLPINREAYCLRCKSTVRPEHLRERVQRAAGSAEVRSLFHSAINRNAKECGGAIELRICTSRRRVRTAKLQSNVAGVQQAEAGPPAKIVENTNGGTSGAGKVVPIVPLESVGQVAGVQPLERVRPAKEVEIAKGGKA